jgi:hypothetical protein
MNIDDFLKFIERTRDCDAMLLDIAVSKGLNRAKNDRLNHSRLIRLAAAVVVSAALCLMMYSELFSDAASGLLRGSNMMTQSDTETLGLYISDFLDTVIKYLGR